MSASTTVAHLGELRVRWISMSSGLQPDRQAGAAAHQRIGERAGQIHVGHRVAELVGLGLLQLDRPFADDRPLMPAGARGFELAENPLQQPALKHAIGLAA